MCIFLYFRDEIDTSSVLRQAPTLLILGLVLYSFRRGMGGMMGMGGKGGGGGRGGAGGMFGMSNSTAKVVNPDEIKVAFKGKK